MSHAVVEVNPADVHIETVDFTEELPYDFNITITTSVFDTEGIAADSIIQATSTEEMVASITLSGMESGQDYLLGVSALGDVTAAVKSKVIEIRCRASGGPF